MESDDSLSLKSKSYFSTAVEQWDSEFYVKVDDDIFVNIGKHMSTPFSSHCKFFLDIHNRLYFEENIVPTVGCYSVSLNHQSANLISNC